MSNTSNVTFGKPKVGGAVYVAPAGTALPTDATTTPDNAFQSLGYISDDGMVNTNSPETDDIKAWGGDVVAVLQTEKADEFKFTLIEVLDVNVLKAVYGDSNVSGTLSTGITVRANSADIPATEWVIDMILAGGVLKRIVIPNGKISEIGDITYKDDELTGYEITIKAMPGDSAFGYDTHKEYIKSA